MCKKSHTKDKKKQKNGYSSQYMPPEGAGSRTSSEDSPEVSCTTGAYGAGASGAGPAGWAALWPAS